MNIHCKHVTWHREHKPCTIETKSSHAMMTMVSMKRYASYSFILWNHFQNFIGIWFMCPVHIHTNTYVLSVWWALNWNKMMASCILVNYYCHANNFYLPPPPPLTFQLEHSGPVYKQHTFQAQLMLYRYKRESRQT